MPEDLKSLRAFAIKTHSDLKEASKAFTEERSTIAAEEKMLDAVISRIGAIDGSMQRFTKAVLESAKCADPNYKEYPSGRLQYQLDVMNVHYGEISDSIEKLEGQIRKLEGMENVSDHLTQIAKSKVREGREFFKKMDDIKTQIRKYAPTGR